MNERNVEQQRKTGWRKWVTAVLFLAALASVLLYVRSYTKPPEDELSRLTRTARMADLVYFYQVNCHECEKVLPYVHRFAERHRDISVAEIESSAMTGIQVREQFDLSYKVGDEHRQEVPAVFCASRTLVGFEEIRRGLPELSSLQASSRPLIPASRAAASLVKRFADMGAISVIVAGLVDSINPCAIAVLLFLISYLAATGTARDIQVTGLTFIAGVFIAYFLLGLGLLNLATAAAQLKWFARVLYPAFALATAVLAGLSFFDFLAYLRKRGDQAVLGLSKSTHAKIHDVVRKRLTGKTMVWGAFLVGFTVSLLELACTGQVYLPTIIYVSSLPGLGLKAMGFLALYNLAFVAPLAAIVICARCGVQTTVLVQAARRYTAASKLCLTLLFLAMLAYMLSMSAVVWGRV